MGRMKQMAKHHHSKELLAAFLGKKKPKYNAKRVRAGGYTFASQVEADRWYELDMLRRAGKIKYLKVHPRYALAEPVRLFGRKRSPPVYEADFEYWDCQLRRTIVEDVKGMVLRIYRLKLHLWRLQHPTYVFRQLNVRNGKVREVLEDNP